MGEFIVNILYKQHIISGAYTVGIDLIRGKKKMRNTTFFSESFENHTTFNNISNIPTREGHIFSTITVNEVM